MQTRVIRNTCQAQLAPSTFATAHLHYRVSNDLSAYAVIIDVDPRIHSEPRWAAELHGGYRLESFDVRASLLAPGEVSCGPGWSPGPRSVRTAEEDNRWGWEDGYAHGKAAKKVGNDAY